MGWHRNGVTSAIYAILLTAITLSPLFCFKLHANQRCPMDNFAGLMVPRPAHVPVLSREENILTWTLVIASGHIPSHTRLGFCSKVLWEAHRPLRLLRLVWLQRIIFQDLHNVGALLQALRDDSRGAG